MGTLDRGQKQEEIFIAEHTPEFQQIPHRELLKKVSDAVCPDLENAVTFWGAMFNKYPKMPPEEPPEIFCYPHHLISLDVLVWWGQRKHKLEGTFWALQRDQRRRRQSLWSTVYVEKPFLEEGIQNLLLITCCAHTTGLWNQCQECCCAIMSCKLVFIYRDLLYRSVASFHQAAYIMLVSTNSLIILYPSNGWILQVLECSEHVLMDMGGRFRASGYFKMNNIQ